MTAGAPEPGSPAIEGLRALLGSAHFERVAEEGAALFRDALAGQRWAEASDAALEVGRAWSNLTRSSEALRWLHEAAQAAQRAGDAERECMAWARLASEHGRHDRLADALAALDEAQRGLVHLRREAAVSSLLASTAATYYGLGLTGPAMLAFEWAVEHAERAGDAAQVATHSANWLIVAHSHHRLLLDADPDAASALVPRMEAELQRLERSLTGQQAPRGHWRLAHLRGCVHLDAARPAEAAGTFEALLAESPEFPAPLMSAIWLSLAKARRALGDEAGCRLATAEALAAADRSGDVPRSFDLLRRSEIAELQGRPDEALALYKRYHHRTRWVMLAAIDSRLESFLARLAEQDAAVEVRSLRHQNAGLAAGVERLSVLAATDPLTGLLNRRGFESQAVREDQGLVGCVLALFDIDRFKAVNDSLGHGAGDDVLRGVARCLASTLRERDLLGRQGGEEFVALLRAVDGADATSVLERMRSRIEGLSWDALAPGLRITISVGAVRAQPGESLKAAFARADGLLYAAKAAGRNRVEVDLDPAAAKVSNP